MHYGVGGPYHHHPCQGPETLILQQRLGLHSKHPLRGIPGVETAPSGHAHGPLPEGANERWDRARGCQCLRMAVGAARNWRSPWQVAVSPAGWVLSSQLSPEPYHRRCLGQWSGHRRAKLWEWPATHHVVLAKLLPLGLSAPQFP